MEMGIVWLGLDKTGGGGVNWSGVGDVDNTSWRHDDETIAISSCFPCDKLALGNVRNTKFEQREWEVCEGHTQQDEDEEYWVSSGEDVEGSEEDKVRVVAIVVYLNRAGKQSS